MGFNHQSHFQKTGFGRVLMRVGVQHGFQPKIFAQLMTGIFASPNSKIVALIIKSVFPRRILLKHFIVPPILTFQAEAFGAKVSDMTKWHKVPPAGLFQAKVFGASQSLRIPPSSDRRFQTNMNRGSYLTEAPFQAKVFGAKVSDLAFTLSKLSSVSSEGLWSEGFRLLETNRNVFAVGFKRRSLERRFQPALTRFTCQTLTVSKRGSAERRFQTLDIQNAPNLAQSRRVPRIAS